MRILFCDDDPQILEQLQKYVTEFFSGCGSTMPDFAAYDHGDLLLQHETSADIAFLDVEMPGISGIHIGRKLKQFNPQIMIFIVTSYPDYLDEAMRFHVFRYLSKPIDKNRLFRNLMDALYQYNMASSQFTIESGGEICVRRAEEIVCVESTQRKVLIHTTSGTLRSTKTIEYWNNTLQLPCFYSPHRSFIINMRYISSIDKDHVTLKYGDNHMEAYLTRRKYPQFKDTYLLYMESVK